MLRGGKINADATIIVSGIQSSGTEVKKEARNFQKEFQGIDGQTIQERTNDLRGLRGVVAHELQHKIQTIEGFAKGTNVGIQSLDSITIREEEILYNSYKRYEAEMEIVTKENR